MKMIIKVSLGVLLFMGSIATVEASATSAVCNQVGGWIANDNITTGLNTYSGYVCGNQGYACIYQNGSTTLDILQWNNKWKSYIFISSGIQYPPETQLTAAKCKHVFTKRCARCQ